MNKNFFTTSYSVMTSDILKYEFKRIIYVGIIIYKM